MYRSRCFVRSTVLITLGLGTVMMPYARSANAQNLNGIFGTRSSEQFFQAGIDRMEQDIESLQARNEEDIEVLSVDESVDVQRQELENEGLSDENSMDESSEATF